MRVHERLCKMIEIRNSAESLRLRQNSVVRRYGSFVPTEIVLFLNLKHYVRIIFKNTIRNLKLI